MSNSIQSISARKILVVDDDESILEAVQLFLELEGYEVWTASDSVGAMQLAKVQQPRLIVLDVLLSGDDGRDIAKLLKKNVDTAIIPIIMMSAHPNVRQSVLDAGADDFMPKPFDMDVLLGFASKYTQ